MQEMMAYLEQLYAMLDPSMAGRPELKQQAQVAAQTCFQEADINGDGQVNFEEFKRWYAANHKTGPMAGSGAHNQGGKLTVDIPEATYCVYHAVDTQGRRLYRSANTTDHKVKTFHKDTFVGYLMVITKDDGSTWQILRRDSSMLEFVKSLRKTESRLVEPGVCLFLSHTHTHTPPHPTTSHWQTDTRLSTAT
jgi:hypothetical protein